MESPDSSAVQSRPWTSLWIVAFVSFVAQLALCQFFTFGQNVPVSLDVDPSNLWKLAYQFPPTGTFQVLNWLGIPYAPQPLNPLSIAAAVCSPWFFFTVYAPLLATCALLAMAAVLRELQLSRPAALFGAVIYAWQGDIIPFVYPGHYGYITAWPFFALAIWATLRAVRTFRWPYAVISGVCCGTMIGLLTNADRGGIASLLVAAIYLAAIFRAAVDGQKAPHLRNFALCVGVAAIVALAPLLALFKSNISGVKMTGTTSREETYKLVTQFSLGPAETLTFLVPGFFGWHLNNHDAQYWGWIGEWPDYPKTGTRNLNLAISTTGTIATLLALVGAAVLLPGNLFGAVPIPPHLRIHGRLLLVLGLVALVLSWGWHTGFYRPLFALPLMDKWRNPLKWIQVTNFALVVLSAVGMERLLASLDPALPGVQVVRRRLTWFCASAVVLLVAGWMCSYGFSIVVTPVLQKEGFDPYAVANIIDTMHRSVVFAIMLAAVICVLLFAFWAPARLRAWSPPNPLVNRAWTQMMRAENLPFTLAITLAVFAAAQLGWVATQFIQAAPLEALTASNPLLDRLRHEGNAVRVSVAVDDNFLNTLLQNQFAAMGISSLEVSAASRIPDQLDAFMNNFDRRPRAALVPDRRAQRRRAAGHHHPVEAGPQPSRRTSPAPTASR